MRPGFEEFSEARQKDERPKPYRWVVRLAVLAGVCYLAWMLMAWFGRNLAEAERVNEARKHTWLVIVDANAPQPDVVEGVRERFRSPELRPGFAEFSEARQKTEGVRERFRSPELRPGFAEFSDARQKTEIDVRRPRDEAIANVADALKPFWDANQSGRLRVVLKTWREDPNAIRHSAWGEGVKMLDVLCAPPAWNVRPVEGQLRVSVPDDPNTPAVTYPRDPAGRSAFAARVYDTILESHRALAPHFARNAPQVPNPKNRQMDRIPDSLSP